MDTIPLTLPSIPPPPTDEAEIWPQSSFELEEEVFVMKHPGVYLGGRVVKIGVGEGGRTVYNIRVGGGKIIARTMEGLIR